MTPITNLKLNRIAVRERWPITPDARQKIVDSTLDVINDNEIEAAVRMTAVRTLAILDALNLKEDENRIRAQPKHIIHSQLSTEELVAQIQQKLEGLPPDALAALIEAKKQGLLNGA